MFKWIHFYFKVTFFISMVLKYLLRSILIMLDSSLLLSLSFMNYLPLHLLELWLVLTLLQNP